jgi:hypothetical protein
MMPTQGSTVFGGVLVHILAWDLEQKPSSIVLGNLACVL